MIRQAISCDICGSEKKQTNHWFVAYDQGGELRLSGWSSRNKLRPGTKHLCGQTCLHKLVDEFMARILAQKPAPHGVELPDSSEIDFEKYTISERTIDRTAEHMAARATMRTQEFEDEVEIPLADADASLTSKAAFHKEAPVYVEDFESSARLIPHPATIQGETNGLASPTILPPRKGVELVAVSTRKRVEEPAVAVPPEEPRFSSRNWRAEAWEREREREMRQMERHTASSIRRRH